MHEPEMENPWEEVPLWQGALATVLFFAAFFGTPMLYTQYQFAEKQVASPEASTPVDLFTPASSPKPQQNRRNTNNLDCPAETA